MSKGLWAVYHDEFFYPYGIGFITNETENSFQIMCSEEQRYNNESWKKQYVKRFKKPESAINFFLSRCNHLTRKDLTRIVLENFPKRLKESPISN